MAQQTYPSYESIGGSTNLVNRTRDFMRLRWTLEGPIFLSVRVLDDPTSATSPHQAYQTATKLHPIANSAITEPKVSSLKVEVYQLLDWEFCWCEIHEAHADPTDGQSVWSFSENPEDPGENPKLMRCCGTDRPQPTPPLVVQASSSTEPFVTIHDYVSAVHPWLMGLREKLQAAMNLLDSEGRIPVGPLPEDTLLLVDALVPHAIGMHDSPPSGVKVREFREYLARKVKQIMGIAEQRGMERLAENSASSHPAVLDPMMINPMMRDAAEGGMADLWGLSG
jgi:hypothetical protein